MFYLHKLVILLQDENRVSDSHLLFINIHRSTVEENQVLSIVDEVESANRVLWSLNQVARAYFSHLSKQLKYRLIKANRSNGENKGGKNISDKNMKYVANAVCYRRQELPDYL